MADEFIARSEKAGWKRKSEDPHPSGRIAYTYARDGKTINFYVLKGVISAETHEPVTDEDVPGILKEQGSGK